MHWKMGSISNQSPSGVEESARVIQSLLDVRADAGFLECSSHLLGDGHKSVSEDAEHDGVNLFCSVGLRKSEIKLARTD